MGTRERGFAGNDIHLAGSAEVVRKVLFGRISGRHSCPNVGAGDPAPAESVVDARGVGVAGTEKDGLPTLRDELLDGLTAQSGRNAAPSIVRSRGHLSESRQSRACPRDRDAARAGESAAVAFEVGDQTVVVDLIAEEHAHRDVGIPWAEYLLPEGEEFLGQVLLDGGFRIAATPSDYALPFLSTRPGRAPVCFPSSITGSPATKT